MSLAIYDKNINGNIQKQHGTDISEYAFRAILWILLLFVRISVDYVCFSIFITEY